MSKKLIVIGTDTNIGKSIFSAGLVRLLGASYWKPIQAGLMEETDSEVVQRLSLAPPERILPERWRLKLPAAPYYAAEQENIHIQKDQLVCPVTEGTLIIEGTGGIMVPINRQFLWIDLLAEWGAPVVLCARTSLGTINHSLLTLYALRQRKIQVVGIAFIGAESPDTEEMICTLGQVKKLGRLEILESLTAEYLISAFASSFQKSDFI